MKQFGCCLLALAGALAACSTAPPVDLAVALKGISKARFLTCSGPPILEYPQGTRDRMSFVTNLDRGQVLGIQGPATRSVASCSVDAVFENARLAEATFSGDQSMCQLVFNPCLGK